MTAKTIVLVAAGDDPRYGEIAVLDDIDDAERLIETLLEAGIGQERIRVFAGAEMTAEITHRPVVALSVAEPQDAQEERSAVAAAGRIGYEDEMPAAPSDTEEHAGRNGHVPLWDPSDAQALESLPELLH